MDRTWIYATRKTAGISPAASGRAVATASRAIDFVLIAKGLGLLAFAVAINWFLWETVVAPLMGWPSIPWQGAGAFTLGGMTFLMIVVIFSKWARLD